MFKDGELDDPDGTFESYWSGPFHTFGAPHLRKRCNEIHVDARGLVDIYVATDYDVLTAGWAAPVTSRRAAGGSSAAPAQFGGSRGRSAVAAWWARAGSTRSAWGAPGRCRSTARHRGYWEIDAYTMSMTTRRD